MLYTITAQRLEPKDSKQVCVDSEYFHEDKDAELWFVEGYKYDPLYEGQVLRLLKRHLATQIIQIATNQTEVINVKPKLQQAGEEIVYRITSQREDIPEHLEQEFEVVTEGGETLEDADKLAEEHFMKHFKNNKNYAWDRLRLLRVNQEEKVTQIAHKS